MARTSLTVWLIGCSTSLAIAQSTSRVSTSTSGAQGDLSSSYFYPPSISADGRHVVFTSRATNLVAGDGNGAWDVFVRDRQLGTTARVSISSAGAEANLESDYPTVSADGRYVAFRSVATNLALVDTNGFADVFVRDRVLGTTRRVNVSTGGAQANGESFQPSIAAEGRYVAFVSAAANLVTGDTNGRDDVFVHDRQIGTTERVSLSAMGAEAGASCLSPSISASGRYVAFFSLADNLVAGDTNGQWDVFVRDRQLGTTARVSVATIGAEANNTCGNPSISADGRYVAFFSRADNLVAGDTNTFGEVFVRDLQLGTTARVSVGAGAAEADNDSLLPSISADGRHVAFQSYATNLVGLDTNGSPDVFVRDRELGTTARVSVSTNDAQADASSILPSISADGRYVAFDSFAVNLVALDTNGVWDIFVRDRVASGVAYCFGDGTGTACPCGNVGPAGAGCSNSVGTGGVLTADGSSSLSVDTLVISGTGMPNGTALYFQGTARANGGSGMVLGDGLSCAAGSVIRLGTKTNAAGASQYPAAGDPSISVRGAVAAPGTRDYQVWYRNAAAFCQPETFNLTNGWEITWEL